MKKRLSLLLWCIWSRRNFKLILFKEVKVIGLGKI
jgi:hypothetical protein